MYGSDYFKQTYGGWEHAGERIIKVNPLPSGVTALKGQLFQELVSGVSGSQASAVLATGDAIGFLTQDVSTNGMNGLQGFKDMTIGKLDNPVANGTRVSLRKLSINGEMECEGLGDPGAGNLIATTGTGAISAATARLTELSAKAGSWYVAQTGDRILGLMLDAALTPFTAGNVRCHIRWLGGAAKKP